VEKLNFIYRKLYPKRRPVNSFIAQIKQLYFILFFLKKYRIIFIHVSLKTFYREDNDGKLVIFRYTLINSTFWAFRWCLDRGSHSINRAFTKVLSLLF